VVDGTRPARQAVHYRAVTEGPTTTTERVEKFELLNAHLRSLQNELREIAKKKPDGVLNTNKVDRLNRLLKDIQALLEGEPGLEYLDLIEESGVPQYSDAVLLLGQYSVAMARFQEKYHYSDLGSYTPEWHTED
jgi:hypothetical protein